MRASLLPFARGGGSFTLPPAVAGVFTVTSAPEGAWPGWANHFRFGTTDLLGYASNDGDISVAAWNGSSSSITIIGGPTAIDHHNAPAVIQRSSDDKLVTVLCSHESPNIYYRISTNPSDPSSWGSAVNIDSSLGGTVYTYPWLAQLNDEASDPIHLIFRYTNTDAWGWSKSTDGGTTWSALTTLVNATRNYGRAFKTSESRIDFAFTSGSYAEDFADVFHFYYEAGDWFKSDGTDIGDPPFTLASDATLVYDGSAAGARYPASIVSDGTEVAIAFPAQTGTPSGHIGTNSDYIYARWNGSAWSTHTMVSGAGASTFDLPEGGLSIDPSNMDRVAASVVSGGDWHIKLYETGNAGISWSTTTITSSGSTDLYPWWILGHGDGLEFAWLHGSFTDQDTFNLGIQGYGTDAP